MPLPTHRKVLPDTVKKKIVAEIDNDLTGFPVGDIARRLAG